MKTAILFATVLVSGAGVSLAAQQAAPAPDQSSAQATAQAATSAQTASTASPAKISAMAYDYMRPVNCELAGKLDSKSAKVGDTVTVKTTAALRTADGSVIPKGAKLVGHLTNVQAHASGQAEAHLSIAFDRAEWGGGHSIPILAVIQAVTPQVNSFASAQNDDSLAGPGGAGTHGMVGMHAGGGGLGGAAGVGTTAGNLSGGVAADASRLGTAAGGSLQQTSQTAGGATGSIGPVAGLGVSAATSASMGAHPTGVAGVMLAGDASGATAGTLSASNRNVHLDSGTQLTIALTRASQ